MHMTDARVVAMAAGLGSLGGGAVFAWRHDPRFGSGFVNAVVNPRLLGNGLAGGARSDIGLIEHVGRRSGIRRLTPVHPKTTPGGFRIMVPLGTHSEWARNVMAAGHCRLRLHGSVYDVDGPIMLPAREVLGLPRPVRTFIDALGVRYLELHVARWTSSDVARSASDIDSARLAPASRLGDRYRVTVSDYQAAVGLRRR